MKSPSILHRSRLLVFAAFSVLALSPLAQEAIPASAGELTDADESVVVFHA